MIGRLRLAGFLLWAAGIVVPFTIFAISDGSEQISEFFGTDFSVSSHVRLVAFGVFLTCFIPAFLWMFLISPLMHEFRGLFRELFSK